MEVRVFSTAPIFSSRSKSVELIYPYGVPDKDNVGRFQYTGQQWVPELGLFYDWARFYSFRQGRFVQTDPIAYADQMNAHA